MDNIKNTNLIPPSPQIDINSLKPFTRFCCSIGAIPTSYLISMSYEEQLLWLCDYLQNTVIPTVNNNGQAVAELQGLYVQLKNYVDNYFTNLDVQEEINNKLDEMAENGELNDILEPLISQKFANLQSQVDSNTSRINEFTSLPDGSTSGDAELTDIRVSYNGQSFPNAGTQVRETDKNLGNAIDFLNNNRLNFVHKNLIDYSKVTENYMITNQTLNNGNVVLSPNTNVVSYTQGIHLIPGQSLYFLLPFTGLGSVMTFDSYTGVVFKNLAMVNNGERVDIDGFNMWKFNYTATKNEIVFFCSQMINGNYKNYSIVDFIPLTNYFFKNETVLDNTILLNSNIKIDVGSSYDFNSLTQAIDYLKNQFFNKAIIYLHRGTYDYEAEGNSGLGYQIPANVDIIGLNNPVISYISSTPKNNTAAIHFPYNNNFENITFKAYNCRYVIHDDNPEVLPLSYVNYKNCIFEYTGTTNNRECIGTTLGCGFGVNHNVTFEGCTFIPYNNPVLKSNGFSIHGNPNQGSTWKLLGCNIFKGSGNSVRVACWGTDPTNDILIINNSNFSDIILDYGSYSHNVNNIEIYIDNDNYVDIQIPSSNILPFNKYFSNNIIKTNYLNNISVNDIINFPTFLKANSPYNVGVVVYNNQEENLCLIKKGGYIPSKFIKGGLQNGFVTVDTNNNHWTNTSLVNIAIGYFYNGKLYINH